MTKTALRSFSYKTFWDPSQVDDSQIALEIALSTPRHAYAALCSAGEDGEDGGGLQKATQVSLIHLAGMTAPALLPSFRRMKPDAAVLCKTNKRHRHSGTGLRT